VDDDAWSDVFAAYEHEDTFEFDYGLGLTDRPMPETVATGTVVGAKGRVLVLENGGTTYAVDLRDPSGTTSKTRGATGSYSPASAPSGEFDSPPF